MIPQVIEAAEETTVLTEISNPAQVIEVEKQGPPGPAAILGVNVQSGTTYTLTAADHGALIRFTNDADIVLSANTQHATQGFWCAIEQAGKGQITLAGTAFVVSGKGGLKTFGQDSVSFLSCSVVGTFNFHGETSPVASLKRLAVIGDSTSVYGFGTRYSSVGNSPNFHGRSNASGLAKDTNGTLTVYANGTATWQAPDDIVGPVTAVGDGYSWLESGSTDKGFGFCITPDIVAASDIGGTANDIYIGGSLVGNIGYDSKSAVAVASFLSGFRLEITATQGMGGTDTAKVLATMPSIFDRDTEGRPIVSPPDMIYATVSINDIGNIVSVTPGYTIAGTLANLTAIKDAAVAQGIPITFSTVHHETCTADYRTNMDIVNAHLLAMAARQPSKVFCADYRAALDDPTTAYGSAYPTYMSGPHYQPKGAAAQAVVLNKLLDGIMGARKGRSAFRNGETNLAVNGDFNGAGDVFHNVTGDCAWGLSCSESAWFPIIGDVTAVCSKETAPNEANPWQVVVTSGNTSGGYVVLSTPLTSIHSRMEAEVEVHLENLNGIDLGSYFPDISLTVISFDAGGAVLELPPSGTSCVASPVEGISGETVLLRLDPISFPVGAVSARLALMWWMLPEGTVKIKARNAGAI